MLKITIPGTPRTKKNSSQVFCISGCRGWIKGQGPQPKKIVIPSVYFKEYESFCIGTKRNPGWLMQWGNICFKESVHVCCLYWFPNRRSKPDLVGLLQATSDLLQEANIIENDNLIQSYDGSRIMGIDKDNPRAEIIILSMVGG